MKGFWIAALAFSGVLLSSCETAKVAQQNFTDFQKMKGEWQISSVDYDKNYKVQPFDENADIQCFVGSTWKLVPNNYTGSYTLSGASGCPSVVQPIKFEVLNGNQFQFKKIMPGTKAKQNTAGYVMNLVDRTDNTFTLFQSVPAGSENLTITYHFIKISK